MTLSYKQLQLIAQILSISNIVVCLISLRAMNKVKKQSEEFYKLFEITKYLVHIMEENDVEIEEFDLIALSELGMEVRTESD